MRDEGRVFYCCRNKLPQTAFSNNANFLSPSSVGWVSGPQLCALLKSLTGLILKIGWAEFLSGGFGEKATSKLSQVVGRILLLLCRTQVPISLLAVSQRSPLAPKSLSLVLPHDSQHLRTSNGASKPSHA